MNVKGQNWKFLDGGVLINFFIEETLTTEPSLWIAPDL
jgi:hypothetical protein